MPPTARSSATHRTGTAAAYLAELHVPECAEPVGYVTAAGVISSPAALEDLRRTACPHPNREPVTLLIWPYEHVADICPDCFAALPVQEG
jgi:hypothetical protein